ncbi:hypothetical protein CHD54_16835 [Salmonella enterica]|nr:hypothetical protein CHD54_16835 [Salmonella enterica]
MISLAGCSCYLQVASRFAPFGVDSEMRVRNKYSDDPYITGAHSKKEKIINAIRPRIGQLIDKLQKQITIISILVTGCLQIGVKKLIVVMQK